MPTLNIVGINAHSLIAPHSIIIDHCIHIPMLVYVSMYLCMCVRLDSLSFKAS